SRGARLDNRRRRHRGQRRGAPGGGWVGGGAAPADAAARPVAAGVPEPGGDAGALVAAALATDRTSVGARAREPLPASAGGRLEPLVTCRVGGIPVSYLPGEGGVGAV